MQHWICASNKVIYRAKKTDNGKVNVHKVISDAGKRVSGGNANVYQQGLRPFVIPNFSTTQCCVLLIQGSHLDVALLEAYM
jgi:hypothetical protein